MKRWISALCMGLALLLLLSCAVLFAGCGPTAEEPEDEEEEQEQGQGQQQEQEQQQEEQKPRTGLEKYPKNSTNYNYTHSQNFAGGYDAGATALRNEILNAPNTQELYAGKITGQIIKISKNTLWSTAKARIKSATAGDAVLLERGGLWRVGYDEDIYVNAGVILGAYGEGEKPKLYGSAKNYAGDSGWARSEGNPNIWTITLKKNKDVGLIVFDEVACLGVRMWSRADVKKTYDFYFDSASRVLYLYYPDDLTADFTDIEIGQRASILQMYPNTVLDNICLRYSGAFAVSAGHQINNVTITNCEIGFIGGSQHHDEVRYGNGIQFGMGTNNTTVNHNWVYQCYDAGITFQSWSVFDGNGNIKRQDSSYHNVEFSENLIEFCCYNIEYFTTNLEENGSYSDYRHIHIVDNVLRFAGYEWSYLQRPDPGMCSQIRGGQWAWVPDTEDFVISGNVFDCAGGSVVHWWWNDPIKNFNYPYPHPGLTVEQNTYYVAKPRYGFGLLYRDNTMVKITDLASAQNAIALFDTNPTAIVWIAKMGRETTS